MSNNSYDTRGNDRYESEVQEYMDQGFQRWEAERLVEGWWLDPAGGLHAPDEEDPAAMYE